MRRGKIITKNLSQSSGDTTGEIHIDFKDSSFGPYSHIFHRENLYFNEETSERGSYFFPLKNYDKANYDTANTEIFIETNDIVIAVGSRGSFSGEEKKFIEIVSLKNKEKYRFYPESVNLIYNAKESVVIYYKKSGKYKRLELNIQTLEKISETSVHLEAFFKLYYNHSDFRYGRLVYKANSRSHMAGYFVETQIVDDFAAPKLFSREKFNLTTKAGGDIDVWESSITGEL